ALPARAHRGRRGTLPGFRTRSLGRLCRPEPIAGGAEPSQGSELDRWDGFAGPSPSREVRNPPRVPNSIVGTALPARAHRGRRGTLPGFRTQSIGTANLTQCGTWLPVGLAFVSSRFCWGSH